MAHTDRKISKRVTNMCIEYTLDTKENFMSHTDRKISERVANMLIEYINWITETKFYVIH
jgi:hypothetical protein